MDVVTQPNANSTRLKWMKRILIVLALIAAINLAFFLIRSTVPSPIVVATHLGGDRFSLTNLTDDHIPIGTLKFEVQRDGQWVAANTVSAPLALLPHQVVQYPLSAPTTYMPSRPWRLHGETTKPVHGLESLIVRVKIYFSYFNQPRNQLRTVFNPNLSVNVRGPDFFAYPVTESNLRDEAQF